MKAFLVSISLLCLFGILLCFFAYTTDRLPGKPIVTASQQVEISQVALNPDETGAPSRMEADPLCSPCVERIAFVLEMVQEWEEGQDDRLETAATPAAQGWAGLAPEQREKVKQLFDQHGPAEGLRHLRETDPDTAKQFERRHIASTTLEAPDDDVPTTQ